MSKYWKSKLFPLDRSIAMRPMKHWHKVSDPIPLPIGESFAGAIFGTNRVVAVQVDTDSKEIRRLIAGRMGDIVNIDQWLTWAELGEIQSCLWHPKR